MAFVAQVNAKCPVPTPIDRASKFVEALECIQKDISNLQAQIDGLKADVASASSTSDEALSAAKVAEAAARRAAAYAEDTNAKLDRLFKKSMQR